MTGPNEPQPELGENVEAVGIDRAGVKVRGKMAFLIAGNDAFLNFRQQYVPFDRRAQRCDEQAVLPADVGTAATFKEVYRT